MTPLELLWAAMVRSEVQDPTRISANDRIPSVYYYFECRECGYDSDEAKILSRCNDGICPLCAGDNGRDVDLKFRLATAEEIHRIAIEKG